MTAAELIEYGIDDGTKQLHACLDGLTEDQVDTKLTPDGMTLREMVPHLAEACVAACEANEGVHHQWGSYQLADNSFPSLVGDLFARREEAKASCTAGEDEKKIKNGFHYLVAHDCYHIGQMVLLRLKADPSWNSDSVYS